MNLKKITLLGTLFLTLALIFVCFIIATQTIPKHVKFESSTDYPQSPTILFVHVASGFGGAEIHSISLYKEALSSGMQATMLVQKNSFIQQELKKLKLPHYETSALTFIKMSKLYKYVITQNIRAICQQHPINIVQCNTERETYAAKNAQISCPIKVIWVRHNEEFPHCMSVLKNLDGLITVSPQMEHLFRQANKHQNLRIELIEAICPFFDYKHLLNHQSQESRYNFFKTHFNLSFDDETVLLCMVANLYSNVDHKNHPLLLQAVAQLIYEKNRNVHLLLVGDGSARSSLEKLCAKLNIADHVHFLGFTSKIPDILYHSDIKVLSSKSEGYGIALTEAAFMKKPLIAATGTCAIDRVINGKTGYLFKNNNADSLAEKIALLVDDPEQRIEMGKAAFDLVFRECTNPIKIERLKNFHSKILSKI